MHADSIRNEKVKILLVDDTPGNLTALEAVLESLDQELVKVHSGAEALRRILTEDFAVILLDVRMPGMDGLETAALIRQRERSRHTPIIFVTAYRDDEKAIQGYDLGAVDYLIKPIQPEILKSKVAVFIDLAKKNQLLKGHAQLLESKNQELEAAIRQRKEAEEEVRVLNRRLEDRLAELRVVNQELEELYRKVSELDELKTRFFADVSHEMRTPLALMLGPTEKLLESSGLTDEQRRAVETVERHMRAVLKHVNDLLDISKLDAGKMEVNYVNVDLVQVMLLAAANFDELARERGISFSVEAPRSAPAQTDPEKLQRILLNLLSNAFKYVPDGGKVRCELRCTEDKAAMIVADSGPGIPHQLRQIIFDRFRRGDPVAGRRLGGTGLGLAIVREFVSILGGTVAVGDAPEGGAEFTIEVPLAAPAGIPVSDAAPESGEPEAAAQVLDELHLIHASETEGAPRQHAALEGSPAAEKAAVLVIEDNPAMRNFIGEALSADYRVELASDGEEGLAKAQAARPDLIVSDVMMPRMGAEQLLREIRARRELAGIPVIVLTARVDPELRTALLRDGARDYLTKPFSVTELRLRVRNLIAMKRAREVLQAELESRSQDLEKLAAELALRKREAESAHAEAEAANRAKDEFLATVSHELRTPLTAVLGWVRLLRTRPFDEATTAQALETIERNARMQAQLIDEILDVSRIITGKLRLEFRPVDLGRVIEAAIDAVRPVAEANGIQLEVELDPRASPASGDPGRLEQVVWNLLSNAVKFTPQGGRVEVRLRRIESRAEISVRDTGQGISPDFLPYVFERFRQADSSHTRSHGGLGLGLAIVRHLVELHGGRVQASSAGVGLGSTFTITLPLLGRAAAEKLSADRLQMARSPVHIPLGDQRPLDGVRVLLVDDEADTREILGRVLGHCGAQVTAVGSAAEGIEILDREPPDVILSDIQMPDQDGYALIRKVREIEAKRGSFIPAAALTAHVRAEDRIRALSAGFQTHVPKPVEPAELVAVVANLAGRSLRR
ncbi:MAG TPA: response regulator [Bryobacterales bacterium]|nr:response regulator [Bryobacterales bacterium]